MTTKKVDDLTIENEVKSAIEEFGDTAYRRFTRRVAPHINHQCALDSNSEFSDYDFNDIQLKPLSELFAHDV